MTLEHQNETVDRRSLERSVKKVFLSSLWCKTCQTKVTKQLEAFCWRDNYCVKVEQWN